jgi:hypothetical protein
MPKKKKGGGKKSKKAAAPAKDNDLLRAMNQFTRFKPPPEIETHATLLFQSLRLQSAFDGATSSKWAVVQKVRAPCSPMRAGVDKFADWLPPSPQGTQITLKQPAGKLLTVDLKKPFTLAGVKRQIAAQEAEAAGGGAAAKDWAKSRVIFAGKPADDAKFLEDGGRLLKSNYMNECSELPANSSGGGGAPKQTSLSRRFPLSARLFDVRKFLAEKRLVANLDDVKVSSRCTRCTRCLHSLPSPARRRLRPSTSRCICTAWSCATTGGRWPSAACR